MGIAYNVKSIGVVHLSRYKGRVTITKGQGCRTSSIGIQEQSMREQWNQDSYKHNNITSPNRIQISGL